MLSRYVCEVIGTTHGDRYKKPKLHTLAHFAPNSCHEAPKTPQTVEDIPPAQTPKLRMTMKDPEKMQLRCQRRQKSVLQVLVPQEAIWTFRFACTI
jgi:hypothetical protein